MKKEYRKLSTTTALFAAADIVSKLIKLVFIPLITYLLTTTQLGFAETAAVTGSLLSPVAMLGTNVAAVRFLKSDSYDKASVISDCICGLTIMAAPMLLVCVILGRIAMFRGYSVLIWFIIVTSAAEGLFMSFTVGLNRNKVYAFSEIVRTVFFAISGAILLIVMKTGTAGYLWSLAAASISRCVYIWLRLEINNYLGIRYTNKELMRTMLRFSLPLVPAAIMWWVMESSDRYILMWIMGASSVGIYAISCRITSLITGISGIFHQAWVLSVIEEYKGDDFRAFYREVFEDYSSILFLISSLLIAFAEPLMMFFNQSYSNAWKYAPILIVGAVLLALGSFTDVNYIAGGKTTGALITSLIGAGTNILMNLLFTRPFGMYGTAASTMLAYYLVWITRAGHTGRMTGTSVNYMIIHVDIIICLLETYFVLNRLSPILTALCPLGILIINKKSVRRAYREAKLLIAKR